MSKIIKQAWQKILCRSKTEEDYFGHKQGKSYFQRFKSKRRTSNKPLIIVHGGPGTPHDYLLNLSIISEKRDVVFYDQYGCGKSPAGLDKVSWEVQEFVEELFELVKALNYHKVNLLGHSWGACVAAEFSLRYPELVEKIVFASPSLSIPLWLEDAKKLIANLPVEFRLPLELGNKKGDYYSVEYQNASDEYHNRYVYYLDPIPEVFIEIRKSFGLNCYHYMWGPNEFTAIGVLKDYDISPRLRELKPPVLYTCGRFDEATPEAVNYLAKLTPHSRVVCFENSAHFPHINEKEIYLAELNKFF